MQELEITNIQQALDFIQANFENEEGISGIKFSDDIISFNADIEGEKYHRTIPSELARGLWEFQEEIYRAVAFALYGEDSIRRLTIEQRSNYQLIFLVSDGSTGLFASLKDFFTKLGEGFTTMDSKHKMVTLVAIAVIMASAWGATHISDNEKEVKLKAISSDGSINEKKITSESDIKEKEIAAKAASDRDAAELARLEVMSKVIERSSIAQRFSKATEDGTRSIIKGASDAKRIKVGKVVFNEEEIQEVNQRSAKEKAEAILLEENFFVTRIEFHTGESTRYWLANRNHPEFPVNIVNEDINADDQQKLINAAQSRKSLPLQVTATFIRGQIKGALIAKII